MKNTLKIPAILILLVSGFILRLFLYNFGTLNLDYHTFVSWSNTLVNLGFKNFYSSWSDYLPGYLYILFLLGKIKLFLPLPELLLYKLPAILSDLVTGYLIYLIVKKLKNTKFALILTSLYIFNPAILANSTLWGQVDSLTALFSLLAIYFAPTNWLFSTLSLTYGATIKPQAALTSLVILFIMFRDHWPVKKIVYYVLTAFIFLLLIFQPFNTTPNLLSFLIDRLQKTMGQYPYTSVNAFNFWGILGLWQNDNPIKEGIGYVLTIASFGYFARKLWDKKGSEYILLAVTFTTSYLFFTRMHERHLLPALAPLLIASSINLNFLIMYFIFSFTYLLNLYYSYIWISFNFKEVFTNFTVKLISLLNSLTIIISVARLPKLIYIKLTNKKDKFPYVNISPRLLKISLFVVLAFAFLSRTLFLSNPPKEYFDEVYHAFTAQKLFHNDPKVWEWWNQSPAGFAYEWTHPPVAKEIMWVGLKLLGENSFAWRLPAALFGTGCVYVLYLLTKELFKDELLAILASLAFSLDGLPLVLSRIGMNDIYFLFFTLLTFYLFVKNKNFFASIALGLAAASKWSTLWAIPVLLFFFFAFNKKLKFTHLFFLLIPLLIYLLTYIPMFTSGHTFDIFIGMQKQMWWYHTNLRATHPYTSPWFTWPFLIRPIWLYTSGVTSNMVSNIYAQGNPLIFWGGFISILICATNAFISKNKKLLAIVFSYFVFFVPWALSPRIMFLYHYLPSVPFMCIALAFVLRKHPKFILPFVVFSSLLFIYFFPHWTGLRIPVWLDRSYYWFDSWR